LEQKIEIKKTMHRQQQPPLLFLCDCRKYDQYTEHKDLFGNYTLWIIEGRKHVAFVDLDTILRIPYLAGTNYAKLINDDKKPEDECLKMISRKFIQLLGYRPDYIVIVKNNKNTTSPCPSIDPLISTCGLSMSDFTTMAAVNPVMHHIRTLAEGPGEPHGVKNSIGRVLTGLLKRLDEKGIFADSKFFDQQPKSIFI
jgi:hypothetical protein